MNQILALHETVLVLEDAISVYRSFELVQKLRETKAQLHAARDKRLKRFSDKQLRLREAKFLALWRTDIPLYSQEICMAELDSIRQELEIRSLLQ